MPLVDEELERWYISKVADPNFDPHDLRMLRKLMRIAENRKRISSKNIVAVQHIVKAKEVLDNKKEASEHIDKAIDTFIERDKPKKSATYSVIHSPYIDSLTRKK